MGDGGPEEKEGKRSWDICCAIKEAMNAVVDTAFLKYAKCMYIITFGGRGLLCRRWSGEAELLENNTHMKPRLIASFQGLHHTHTHIHTRTHTHTHTPH